MTFLRFVRSDLYNLLWAQSEIHGGVNEAHQIHTTDLIHKAAGASDHPPQKEKQDYTD